MSMALLLITAAKIEGRAKREVAGDYGLWATGFSSWSNGTRSKARPRSSLGRKAIQMRSAWTSRT
jgi:hypothetical protein